MRPLRFVLAAALCLGLAGPALAAPMVNVIPTPKGGFFQVQTRPFKPGDRYRYLAETKVSEAGGETPTESEQTSRAIFEIEVLSVDAASGQPTLRFTLREMTIVDASQPGIQRIMNAFVGVPVDFRTLVGIHPADTLNGEAVRKAVLANLDRMTPNDSEIRTTAETLLNQLAATPDGLSNWMAADLSDLAGMYEPRIPNEPLVIPTQTRTLEDGSILISDGTMKIDAVEDSQCRVTFSRETRTRIEAKGYQERLVTQASVATDGLPVVLTQVETKAAPGDYRFHETLTLTRQSSAPGCS